MTDQNNHRIQISEIQIVKNKNGETRECKDLVAIEQPLQININHSPVTVTMRTPGDDKALALGFLFTEGILHEYADVIDINEPKSNEVNINIEEGVQIDLEKLDRNFYTTSSCGVCGKSSIEAITTKSEFDITQDDTIISEEVLFSLPDKLLRMQSVFEATGGLHAAALFNHEGRFLYHSEDVGRHNALDKLIGHSLLSGRLPLKNHVLLLSGRASFELVQKASMAGIPIIAAVGAPSSLAIELAQKQGQTLVGFLKKSGYNIYSNSQRINQ